MKKNKKYKLLLIEPDGSFVKKLREFKPNLVLNLLHGRYGEDGYIQSILESEKVRYSHSGVLSSRMWKRCLPIQYTWRYSEKKQKNIS